MNDDHFKKIFSKNLRYYMKLNSKTQIDLIRDLNINKSAISTWCNGTRLPRMDKVDMLAKYFHINRSDLIEEKNEASGAYYFLDNRTRRITELLSSADIDIETTDIDMLKKYKALAAPGREHVDAVLQWETEHQAQLLSHADRIAELEALQQAPSVPLRIYTYLHKIAAAGTGFYFDDIPTDTIEAPYHEGADFIIGVSGDSMEPTYHDGDLVYVEKCQSVNIGEIGIFTLHKECFIKEMGEEGLISHNADYKLIPGTEDISCFGRVLGKVENRQKY